MTLPRPVGVGRSSWALHPSWSVDCDLSTGLSVDVCSSSARLANALSLMFIAALWSALSDHPQRRQSNLAPFLLRASTYPQRLQRWLV